MNIRNKGVNLEEMLKAECLRCRRREFWFQSLVSMNLILTQAGAKPYKIKQT